MAEEIGLFEAMKTMRAIRRFKPDPVPEPLLWRVIEAATMAPNGGNRQVWHFVVVRDPETKRFIQERYHQAFDRYVEAGTKAMAEGKLRFSEKELGRRMRIAQAGLHLANHLGEVPVLLFACIDRAAAIEVGGDAGRVSGVYASIYPAVQNILLACRGLGLGAVLTTLHLLYEQEIRERLGIPDGIVTAAMIPVGYPADPFGPVARRPPEEVTHWDAWGTRQRRG
ncbi:MAG: nitroreductase family protein [Acidobacteriota bacterium]